MTRSRIRSHRFQNPLFKGKNGLSRAGSSPPLATVKKSLKYAEIPYLRDFSLSDFAQNCHI